MSYNYEDLSFQEAKELLRKWRENNERRSEDVVDIWMSLSKHDIKKFGNEKHMVLEQVIFAALDCHGYGIANYCIYLLHQEFPGSTRVMRYNAALLEAEGKYKEALEVLDELIKEDETNALARKRRIAIIKAQGLVSEAIKELIDYLKKFMSDVEAWQELCSLYLQQQEYSKAAFCCEELLLHQPHHHLILQHLADIRYTMGGVENLEMAKIYYCQALKLNPDNMRAILGLFLTASNLAQQHKSGYNSLRRTEYSRLAQWASTRAGTLCRPRHTSTTQPRPPPLMLTFTE